MAQLGETQYYSRNINGKTDYFNMPWAGNVPYDYTPISKEQYGTGLQTKLAGASDADRPYFQRDLDQFNSASGNFSPTFKDPILAKFQGDAPTPSAEYFTPEAKAQYDQSMAAYNKNALTPFGTQAPATPGAQPATTADQIVAKYKATLANLQGSGTEAPTTQGAASAAISGATPPPPPPGPNTGAVNTALSSSDGFQSFMDNFQMAFSPQAQQTSLAEDYQTITNQLGIPALNTQLMNMKNVIDGTEDDVRNEVTKAGGFATDSQVMALSAARNKVLIKNYNSLLDQKQMLSDQVNTMIGLEEKDRTYAQAQMMQQFNMATKLFEMQQNMQKNATDTMQNNIKQFGAKAVYDAAIASGDPTALQRINSLMGPGFDIKTMATQPDLSTQKAQLDIENQKLQNQKLKQEINTGPAVSTQVVDVNGKKLLINTKTGKTISEIGAGDTSNNTQKLAQAQGNIDLINGITKDTAIRSAVGPTSLGRLVGRGFDSATGARQNFIAGVEQLTSQLTLDSLVNAKAQGATFGALSEGELNTLVQSASKIGKWAIKDSDGKVKGYNASEKDFKKELDKINNFAKLDYVLKGGDPSSIAVITQPDGSMWVTNSDGSMTKLK